MWKQFLIATVVTCLSAVDIQAKGTVHVRGYTRKDGTYVRPHTRSAPGSGSSSSSSSSYRSSTDDPPYIPPAREEARTTYRVDVRTAARTQPRVTYPTLKPQEQTQQAFGFTDSDVERFGNASSSHPASPPVITASIPADRFPWRIWTDLSGHYTLYAKLKSVISTHVKLQKEDLQIVDVPIDQLSMADQEYLKTVLH